ncbi:hypothetical protein KKH18_07035 [bacterium]|nr:hypothetical protein [bacterium]
MQWNYCPNCYASYRDDGRRPPCMTNADGLCKYTLEPPFFLAASERLAWDVFQDVISYSGPDSLKLPSLDKLEWVINHRLLRDMLGDDRCFRLIENVRSIASIIRQDLISKRHSES